MSLKDLGVFAPEFPLKKVLFCEPKHFENMQLFKKELEEKFQCFGFEIVPEYSCDANTAYLINEEGGIFTIHIIE